MGLEHAHQILEEIPQVGGHVEIVRDLKLKEFRVFATRRHRQLEVSSHREKAIKGRSSVYKEELLNIYT